jgi:uncharacterized protein (DUF1778 family)
LTDTNGDPHHCTGRASDVGASSTALACNGTGDPQHCGGASCSSRATVGGTRALGPAAEAAAGQAPAGAPEQEGEAEHGRALDQQQLDPFATTSVLSVPEPHRADDESARTHPEAAVGTDPDGRVAPEVFLHEGVAALDRPSLVAEHKGSEVLKPSRQRKRGSQPRSETPSVRFTPDEITLLEQAAAERGPSLSGFIADAAVAVATNRITALLPHERAVRAIGEELGRALHAFGKAANNLNQLVRQGHMGITDLPAGRAERSLDLLDQVTAEIHRATLRLNEPGGQC